MDRTSGLGKWGKRIVLLWLIIAVVVLVLYFFGVLSGYFGSYDQAPVAVPLATKLGRAIWPFVGISFILSAISVAIWQRTAQLPGATTTSSQL